MHVLLALLNQPVGEVDMMSFWFQELVKVFSYRFREELSHPNLYLQHSNIINYNLVNHPEYPDYSLLSLVGKFWQFLVYVPANQGHKAVSIHFNSLSVLGLYKVPHELKCSLQVLLSYLLDSLILLYGFQKGVVYLVDVDWIENHEGEIIGEWPD